MAKGVADRFGDAHVVRRMRAKGLPFLQRLPHLSHRRARFCARHVACLKEHPMLPACAPPPPQALAARVRLRVSGGRKAVCTSQQRLCRRAGGHLVKEALAEHPQSPFFVIVRPNQAAPATAGSTPRIDGADTADASSMASLLSAHPSSYVSTSLLQTAASPRSAASSGDGCPQVRHYLRRFLYRARPTVHRNGQCPWCGVYFTCTSGA